MIKESFSLIQERDAHMVYAPEVFHPFKREDPEPCEGIVHRFPMGGRTCMCGEMTVHEKEYKFNKMRKG